MGSIEALYTIGFTKKTLRRFVELLKTHRIDGIVDVRLRNTSQLAGWAKKDDLAYILGLVGVAYRHEPDVAPTAEMMSAWRATHDWDAYAHTYRQLIDRRGALGRLRVTLQTYERPCLLCAEAEPTHCHRGLLADRLGDARPIRTVHLT